MADEEILRATAVVEDKASETFKKIAENAKESARQQAGLNKQAKRDTDELSGSFSKLGEQVKGFLDPALKTFGITLGSLSGSIIGATYALGRFAERGEHLEHLSNVTKFTTSELTKLTNAGYMLGVSAETTEGGLRQFAETMNKSKTWAGESLQVYQRLVREGLGPLFQQARQAWMLGDTARAFQLFADAMKGMDPWKASILSREVFGTDVLARMGKFNEIMKELPRYVQIDTSKSEAYLKQYRTALLNLESTYNHIANEVMPPFTGALRSLNEQFASGAIDSWVTKSMAAVSATIQTTTQELTGLSSLLDQIQVKTGIKTEPERGGDLMGEWVTDLFKMLHITPLSPESNRFKLNDQPPDLGPTIGDFRPSNVGRAGQKIWQELFGVKAAGAEGPSFDQRWSDSGAGALSPLNFIRPTTAPRPFGSAITPESWTPGRYPWPYASGYNYKHPYFNEPVTGGRETLGPMQSLQPIPPMGRGTPGIGPQAWTAGRFPWPSAAGAPSMGVTREDLPGPPEPGYPAGAVERGGDLLPALPSLQVPGAIPKGPKGPSPHDDKKWYQFWKRTGGPRGLFEPQEMQQANLWQDVKPWAKGGITGGLSSAGFNLPEWSNRIGLMLRQPEVVSILGMAAQTGGYGGAAGYGLSKVTPGPGMGLLGKRFMDFAPKVEQEGLEIWRRFWELFLRLSRSMLESEIRMHPPGTVPGGGAGGLGAVARSGAVSSAIAGGRESFGGPGGGRFGGPINIPESMRPQSLSPQSLLHGRQGLGARLGIGHVSAGGQSTNLQTARARFEKELGNPQVRDRLIALAKAEVGGQGPQAEQAFMESVLNRATARGQSIEQTIRSGPGQYYPGGGDVGAVSSANREHFSGVLKGVMGGSNVSNYATGNASGSVGFGYGKGHPHVGETLDLGLRRERFGVEKPDAGWQTRSGIDAGGPNRLGGAIPGEREGGGIKPEFPVASNVNWQNLNPEYVARVNAAYKAMPESEKAKFKMISGFRPATRAEARKLGMSESSSQEDIYDRATGGGAHPPSFAAAPPGRSRHQQGTAGDFTRTDWLREHGAEFGLTGIRNDYPHIQMANSDARSFASRLDRANNNKISGNIGVNVNVKAPRGTKADVTPEGQVFNPVKVTRASQMDMARDHTDSSSVGSVW